MNHNLNSDSQRNLDGQLFTIVKNIVNDAGKEKLDFQANHQTGVTVTECGVEGQEKAAKLIG